MKILTRMTIYLRIEGQGESEFSDKDSEEATNKSNKKLEEMPDKTIFSEKNEPLIFRR